MIRLRIKHSPQDSGAHRVELALDEGGGASPGPSSTFDFSLTGEEHEQLRWYWEDFLRDHPLLQPGNSLRRAIPRMTSIVDSEVASRPVYLTYKDVAIDRRYHLEKEGMLYRVDGRK